MSRKNLTAESAEAAEKTGTEKRKHGTRKNFATGGSPVPLWGEKI